MALKMRRPADATRRASPASLGILKQSFGERFQTGQSFREQHAHTTAYSSQLPDGVLFAESADDVKAAVEVCAGTGSCPPSRPAPAPLEGQVNARKRRHLDRFQPDEPGDRVNGRPRLHGGAGRHPQDLNTHLRDTGLFPDRSRRQRLDQRDDWRRACVRHQRGAAAMKDNVLSVTAVTAK